VKILTVIGARPQFIKAATVSRVIAANEAIEEVLLHTGQHYDSNMSAIFFEELDIPQPKYNLGISGTGHGEQTGKMLVRIEEVLLTEKPDFVVVYGDTNSTLAGALAAVKLHIPLAHVEAGLRSFNRKMPEEINRILTDHSAEILFVPTDTAFKNLESEGIDEKKIMNVGDVMLDATIHYIAKAEKTRSILSDLNLAPKSFVLVTIHRAENTDDSKKLKKIFDSLENLTKEHRLLLPLHPRTLKGLTSINFALGNSDIQFIDPVGYLDMLILEKNAKMIITDSGGVQKEAYFHRVPCITMREETEWTELVENGCNFLARPENLSKVYNRARSVEFSTSKNMYGDGDAALKIVNTLESYFKKITI